MMALASVASERELFTPEDKEVLRFLKSPQFLFEKSKEERQGEAYRFFVFLLRLDSAEDKNDLKKLNFTLFSKMEDESMINESRERFIQEMRRMEEQE